MRLLPEWVRGELIPTRHWHWIFYLAPAAALFGPVTLADGVYRAERWLHWLVAAFVFALLLAPNWSNLSPSALGLACSIDGVPVLIPRVA